MRKVYTLSAVATAHLQNGCHVAQFDILAQQIIIHLTKLNIVRRWIFVCKTSLETNIISINREEARCDNCVDAAGAGVTISELTFPVTKLDVFGIGGTAVSQG